MGFAQEGQVRIHACKVVVSCSHTVSFVVKMFIRKTLFSETSGESREARTVFS